MYSFDSTDILLFLGISQGVFLAVALSLMNNRNKSANKVLSLILIMSVIMMTGRLYYFGYHSIEIFARLAMLVDSIIFLFGPLLYLYIKRMIISGAAHSQLSWYELLPTSIHVIFVFWTYFYSVQELMEMYKEGLLFVPFFLTELTSIILLTTYLVKCFILLKRFRLVEERILSYHQQIFFYLRALVSVFSIITFFWVLNFTRSYVFKQYNPYFNYNIIWLTIPILMYVVGFYSLKQPEIFRVPVFEPPKKTPKSRLSQEKIEKLRDTLEKLLVKDKIYLNPNLSLADLAAQLNTSTNDLSYLLNKIHKCSFYEYINKYRVDEFIAKIQKREHEQHTILALSLDSGFNSKSTFNKAFKAIINDTPSNYIKKLHPI